MGRFILVATAIPFAMVAIIVIVAFGAGVRSLSPSLVVLPAALIYCVGGALYLRYLGLRRNHPYASNEKIGDIT